MPATYPMTVDCQRDDCTWTHEAVDEDDAIDAWEAHTRTTCPQQEQPSSPGPDDPIGTVRAGTGALAIRARSANPDYADDLVWYIVDTSDDEDQGAKLAELDLGDLHQLIDSWPIVYPA